MGTDEEELNKQTRMVVLCAILVVVFIIFLIVIGYKNLDKTVAVNSDNLMKTPGSNTQEVSSSDNTASSLSETEDEIADAEVQEEKIEEKIKNNKYNRNYDDPFYKQIFSQIKKQKNLGYNDLSFNYYPGENYIKNATDENGHIHIFKKNPILIYVPPGEYYDPITQAFVAYNNNFKGVLSFRAVSNPNESDIKIVLTDDFSNFSDLDGAIGLGAPKKYDKDGNIVYSELKILNQDNLGGYKPTLIAVYNTALHEIGHCIGILGHSPDEGDILYKSLDLRKDSNTLRDFSYRDKETIKLMYSGRKDYISNAIKNAQQEKLKENLQYAKESNNSDSYLILADSYYGMKQYDKALEAYKKALELNKDNFRIYLKLADCYEKAKKYDEEITFSRYALKKAQNDEDKAISNTFIANGYYNKKNYEEALSYSYTALVLDPQKKDYFANYIEICYILNKKTKAKEAYDTYISNYNTESFDEEEKKLINWAKN